MIEVKENVYWDEASQHQSEEVRAWLREDIYPLLACNATEMDKIQPTYDEYKRPVRWTVVRETYKVEITREYIYPHSSKWSFKGDKVSVTPNRL